MTRPQSPPCVYGISPFKIDLLSKLYRFPGASEFEILKDYEQDRDSLTRRCIVRADCVALHVIDISIINPAINCLLTVHRNLSLLEVVEATARTHEHTALLQIRATVIVVNTWLRISTAIKCLISVLVL